MSLVHAIDLQQGDTVSGEVITSIEKSQEWVKVWTNHQFVPKCFRPKEPVYIK